MGRRVEPHDPVVVKKSYICGINFTLLGDGEMDVRDIDTDVESDELKNAPWAAQYESMRKWLKGRKPHTRSVLTSIFRGWVRWLAHEGNGGELAGLNPDELVNFQDDVNENGSKRRRYLTLDKAFEYVTDHGEKWRLGYQEKIINTIKSFFADNRVDLPRDKKISRKLRASDHVEESPEKLVKDPSIVRRVLGRSNRFYRAVFLAMFMGGMGLGEIIEWSSQGLEAARNRVHWNGEELLEIQLPKGRKTNNKAFYTLIGGDALKALDKYLEERERRRKVYEKRRAESEEEIPPFPDDIFVTNINTPLRAINTIRNYWLRQLDRLGVIDQVKGPAPSKRYGYHIHQLRDCFRSQVSPAKMDRDVADFLMGHTIDRMKYNQFYNAPAGRSYIYEEYVKALPYLNIWTSDLPLGKVDATALSKQEKQIRELKEDNERLGTRLAQLEDLVLSLSSGSGASRYPLETLGHSRPEMHNYTGSILPKAQQEIIEGKELSMVFDTKTGKWCWIGGVIIKL